jgi:Na+/melibiose symporter-like transporter
MTGGLGLNTKGTSNVLLAQAAAAIIAQILAVPKIIEKRGPLRSYRLALSILICHYCAIPFAAALPQYLGVTAIIIDLSVYALVNGLGTTCSAIL